jgi:WD40 repeat protein
MPNGTGLLGDPSSTQSGIIAPHPGNSDLFYLFSLDQLGLPDGLRYSIVDMSLDNGFGDVTSSKNVLLHTPSTEKITAITHANGNDIWVVTHKYLTNEFFTYLIDNTGINSTPITTSLGFRPIVTSDALGCMKISPDGSKIAVAYGNEGLVEIFDFDTNTGIISNLIQIPGQRNLSVNGPNLIYGIEFSPNSNYLYVSAQADAIFQFDITSFNQNDIINSKIRINPTPAPPSNIDEPFNNLQLGPDGKRRW